MKSGHFEGHWLVLAALLALCQPLFSQSEFWNDPTFAETPEIEWGARDGMLQEAWYSNVPYRGKPTRAFAYVGRPSKGTGPFPAMVLMHGGGGRAFRAWAEHWASRGYVCIAMDLGGLGAGEARVQHPNAGPKMGNLTILASADSDESLRDAWTYHAVAAAMRAHTLLRTMPEVDPERIGITGISWGGYATCMVAGLDHRLKVAAPVYGCGYLQDNSYWTFDIIDTMEAEHRERWVRNCDPSGFLANVACPILFTNGTNDPRFFLDLTFRSALLVRPEYRNLNTMIGLKHGHNWKIVEVERFIDSVLAGGAAIPRLGQPEIKGLAASAKIIGNTSGQKGFINYAKADVPWKDRKWKKAPAKITGDMISATLPDEGEMTFYFSLSDSKDLQATGECGSTTGISLFPMGKKAPAAEEGPATSTTRSRPEPIQPAVTNGIGMELVSIGAGSFQMGQLPDRPWLSGGEWDEIPLRTVEITQPFLMSVTEVTNAQYEKFAPEHRKLRGQRGFSSDDDEAVTFVSWEDANRFCEWLGKQEGKPYRLPTEAEWEYACRAGTITAYSTGDVLPPSYYKEQSSYDDFRTSHAKHVSLKVKQSPPNAWGLHDMYGNLEEWCHDWYGPYDRSARRDPVGRARGYARVTRGGSHNTDVYYLRSANRAAALPDDAGNFYIGFRVVQAALPKTDASPNPAPPLVMRDVSQTENTSWTSPDYDSEKPWFNGPRPYVKIPEKANGPLFWFHNHNPAITYCDNGDLLAIWFTTQREWGRELAVAGSRLRHGFNEWDPASLFFNLADRNDHAPALWRDDNGLIHHFNGTGLGSSGGLATIMRTSADNGATWTQPRFIKREHASPRGCAESIIKTEFGRLIVPVDSFKSTELLISDDDGKTWRNPAKNKPVDEYKAGRKGSRIAGIHATLVELKDGSLLAFGRDMDVGNRLAMSRSHDQGETWQYMPSAFSPLSVGQRPVVKRLREGPLLMLTFTDRVINHAPFELGVQRARTLSSTGITVKDDAGGMRKVWGLYAALSYDEGKTWPVKKLITPGGDIRKWFGHGWTKQFMTSDTDAEPMGYLAATQTPDGKIHLLTSGLHYEFNLAWLKQPMPAKPKT